MEKKGEKKVFVKNFFIIVSVCAAGKDGIRVGQP